MLPFALAQVLGHIVRYGLYSNNAPRKGDKRSPGL
jgi:hypothetical protein